ncbi:MAG: MoxR family ATPase [Pseudomonadota bacterium]
MDTEKLRQLEAALDAEISKLIVGQKEAQCLLLIGLLIGGHVLFEGPPGTAKTLLCRTFAKATNLQFSRIQFTPDLMPGDVLGSNLFNFKESKFELILGPVFTEILLADEINRTPPKTQSALLEAMNERSVTIDGTTHTLSEGFMVVATQNPLEQQGTYPLPEAQLDRFLFMHILDYPERDDEIAILANAQSGLSMKEVKPITNLRTIVKLRKDIKSILLTEEIASYIVDLVGATRRHPALAFGASPRAAVMLADASRAMAALEGRDFVIPDDVKDLVAPTLRHRVIVSPDAEIDGMTAASVLDEIVSQTEAPR